MKTKHLLSSALCLFVITSTASADSKDTGKINVKGRIFSPLSISSTPSKLSKAAGPQKTASSYTSVSNRSIYLDCGLRDCESIDIKAESNSHYSLSFLNDSASEVSCGRTEGSTDLSGALNVSGRMSHLCSYDKGLLPLKSPTIVLTFD